MSLSSTFDRKLNLIFVGSCVSVAAWITWSFPPHMPHATVVAAGCVLSWFASLREMARIKQLGLYLIDIMERVCSFPCEAGDRVGSYQGAPIFEWVKIVIDGPRYAYTGTARVHQLANDEVFVWPGLIYRLVA